MEIEVLNPWLEIKERQRAIEENVQFAIGAASAAYAATLWRRHNWYMYELTRKSLARAQMRGVVPCLSPHHNDFIGFVDVFLRDYDRHQGTERSLFMETAEPGLIALIQRTADAMTIQSQELVAQLYRETSAPCSPQVESRGSSRHGSRQAREQQVLVHPVPNEWATCHQVLEDH